MWVAPLGAFGSIAFTVGKFGTSSLLSLAELILEFYTISLLFVFLVLGGVAWWAGVSLFRLLRYHSRRNCHCGRDHFDRDGAAAAHA